MPLKQQIFYLVKFLLIPKRCRYEDASLSTRGNRGRFRQVSASTRNCIHLYETPCKICGSSEPGATHKLAQTTTAAAGFTLQPNVTDPDHRDLVLAPGVHRQSPEQSRAGHTQACHLIKLCDRQTHKTTAHCRDCRRSRTGLPDIASGTRNHGVNP